MTALNDYQRQTILSGFRDIHRRLAEMESMLVQSLIDSPFTQYVNDTDCLCDCDGNQRVGFSCLWETVRCFHQITLAYRKRRNP
jgi:hypothetical protein